MSNPAESTPLMAQKVSEVKSYLNKAFTKDKDFTENEFSRDVDYVNAVFSKQNVDSAKKTFTTKFQDLRKSASEGDFSIRLLALVGGVVLVLSAAAGFFGLIFSFQLSSAVLEFYTLCLGLVMLLLESHGILRKQHSSLSQEEQASIETQVTFMESLFRNIFKYAMFLKFVWGRGGLYFVAGSLQLAQGAFADYLVGGFVMFVGVLYIWVGQRTAAKLTKLRQALAEHTLREKFSEADQQGDGKLSMDDFQGLTESLGMSLTRREREVAFLAMDKRDEGAISFGDFKAWWSDWEEGAVI